MKRIFTNWIFLIVILLAGCSPSAEINAIPNNDSTLVPTEILGPATTPTPRIPPAQRNFIPTVLPSPRPTLERFQQLPSYSLPEFNARYSTGDLAMSADGKYLAVASKNRQNGAKSIWIWNARNFTTSAAGYQMSDDVWSVAFSSDGKQLAVGCAAKIIFLDWKTGNLITTIDVPNAVVVELIFGPDHTLAFSDFNDSVTVWDLTLNKIKYSVAGIAGFEPNHFALSPDGRQLVTANDSEMLIWDYQTGKRIDTRKNLRGSTGFAPAFAFSADGKYLAVGGCSQFQLESCVRGELLLWESDTLALDLSSFSTSIQSLAFSADSRYIAIAGTGDHGELLDLTNQSLKPFPSLAEPVKIPPDDSFSIYDMVFLTNRNELVVTTTDGIQLLDATTLRRAPNLSFLLRLNYPYQVTAAGDNINFRTIPSLNGTIITKLHKGDGFNTMDGPILADHLTWWKVKIQDGTEGWIIERPGLYQFDP